MKSVIGENIYLIFETFSRKIKVRYKAYNIIYYFTHVSLYGFRRPLYIFMSLKCPLCTVIKSSDKMNTINNIIRIGNLRFQLVYKYFSPRPQLCNTHNVVYVFIWMRTIMVNTRKLVCHVVFC